MCRCIPREEPYDFGLENKDYPDTGVEPSEVRRHRRKRERGSRYRVVSRRGIGSIG